MYESMSQHTLIQSVYMLSHITDEKTGHHHPTQAHALGFPDSSTVVGRVEGAHVHLHFSRVSLKTQVPINIMLSVLQGPH